MVLLYLQNAEGKISLIYNILLAEVKLEQKDIKNVWSISLQIPECGIVA